MSGPFSVRQSSCVPCHELNAHASLEPGVIRPCELNWRRSVVFSLCFFSQPGVTGFAFRAFPINTSLSQSLNYVGRNLSTAAFRPEVVVVVLRRPPLHFPSFVSALLPVQQLCLKHTKNYASQIRI
ncbi:unnamed protein product [Protopolystoma xenopodis]|uniref:Uncharacterized protein n=1 Tax=Protopolystoma xenopodis TaxID=117903 RepID=A0A448XI94_9PLAT|nr:unnamed protein product [Protopolystoma xenopodis]